ncbi:MAG: hypothetical protein V4717_01830 [Bacteroidota bacterium]
MQFYLKQIFLSASIFLVTVFCQAQDIDSLLAIQNQADPQEKVFVHFDKNYYNPGETIWFKAYLFEGLNRSSDTKNFYAELRDDKGILLDRKTAPVIFSGAASHFQLPDSFTKSIVFVRAYTVPMLNGDTGFIFVKPLRIIQNKKSLVKILPTVPEIKFLPEGGDWITGLPCNMAFIAKGANDLPVSCSGFVKDANGKQIVSFVSLHDGMGSFAITPETGQQYTAVWKDEKGKEYSTALPKARETGLALTVATVEGAKRYSLQRQADAPEELKSLTVIGILNQQLVYQAKINLAQRNSVAALMPVNELPSGTLAITVFDKNMKPVAERLCFVNNNNFEFDADAWISDLNIGKRSLNRGEVKVADTLMANLSLSITDADLDVPAADQDNIVTRMLFTGELRGKINKPYYYFFSTSDSAAYHLDLVMLTHGWRRYNWDKVFAGKVNSTPYKESNYLTLNGKVIGSGSVFEPGLTLNGFMRTMDSASNFVTLPVDRKGNVISDGLLFYDSAKLYLQFSDKQKAFEPSMLSINNGLLEGNQAPNLAGGAIKAMPYEPDSLTAANNLKNNQAQLKVLAKMYKDAHMLDNVTVTAKAKSNVEKMDEKYASGLFGGGDAKSFDLVNDPTANSSFSIFQYLQGKVAGLQINASGANPTMSWRGGTPVLYLNEMQSDVSQIQSLNMQDIAYVKVFNPSSAGAIRSSGGGVISIYTKKGGDANTPGDSKLGVVNLFGYSAIKQFYSPDYASSTTDVLYEDLRKTLYWNPFIILEKNKKRFKFQFYNNDVSTRFRIVLEGLNDEGKLVHIEKVVTK